MKAELCRGCRVRPCICNLFAQSLSTWCCSRISRVDRAVCLVGWPPSAHRIGYSIRVLMIGLSVHQDHHLLLGRLQSLTPAVGHVSLAHFEDGGPLLISSTS